MRIVIADDHYLVREGTRQLLEATGEVEVVASVESAETLIDAVRRFNPDAVICDIRMPPGHRTEGIDAAHAIRRLAPQVGIVILSQYSSSLYAFELFRNGTTGLAYLLKDRVGDVSQLLRALREVVTGGSVIDPRVVEGLVSRRKQLAGSLLSTLTPRELDVLSAMAEGKSNASVAEALFISQSAVEKHINSIFVKLGLSPEDAETHRRVMAVLALLRDYAEDQE